MHAKSLKHQMKLIYSTEVSLLFNTPPPSTLMCLSHLGTLQKAGIHNCSPTPITASLLLWIVPRSDTPHHCAWGLHWKITILLYEQMSHT